MSRGRPIRRNVIRVTLSKYRPITENSQIQPIPGLRANCSSAKSCYKLIVTRKLCYRKDDRAMRPIYGCSEYFRDS